MSIRILPVLFVFFALSAIFPANSAHAQFAGGGNAPVTPTLNFGQKNPQLKIVLELQSQLQLLHRLIDHETAVNDMIAAAVDVGITNPAIPVPDKELCQEVPANIPCAQAYNNLYSNFSVEKKPAYVPPPVVVASAVTPKKDKHVAAKKPKPVEIPVANIFWSDITCLGGKCTAVISDNPTDPRASYRISMGEKLPDGSVINAISAAGVSILRDKKVIQLDPAPQG